jgi:hypothetical protein
MRAWVAVWLFVLVAGCKTTPKAGDVCKIEEEGTFVCADATTALRCVGTKRVSLPCRGPKGCAAGVGAICDTSLGREGDACVESATTRRDSFLTCSEDKSAVLRCKDKKLVFDLRCRGPKGCDPKVTLGDVSDHGCDRTIAAVGDACNTRVTSSGASGVCSVDGKNVLMCDKDENGAFIVSRVCGGPAGCKVGPLVGADYSAPACDHAGVAAGSPCAKDDPRACSADGALLACDVKSGRYAVEPCPKKMRCVQAEGTNASCKPK